MSLYILPIAEPFTFGMLLVVERVPESRRKL